MTAAIILLVNGVFNFIVWPPFYRRTAADPRARDAAGKPTRFLKVHAILIGSATPGSGEVFDWSLAEGAPAGRKVIICGGLTPDNVADAIERIDPWGVDVASGGPEVGGVAIRTEFSSALIRRFSRHDTAFCSSHIGTSPSRKNTSAMKPIGQSKCR